jgi:thioesterase-3
LNIQQGISKDEGILVVATRFETEIMILPSHIDVNGHVHHSAYLDFLLAARYDQMARCYKMSMDEFLKLGFTWFVRKYDITYRTPIKMGDTVLIRTWVDSVDKMSVDIGFEMVSKKTDKQAARGIARYVLVDVDKGRPVRIPDEAVRKYSI